MKLVEAEEFLRGRDIKHPELEVINPSINDYDVLLLQPKGRIEASKSRVGNRDNATAAKQYSRFLEHAAERKTDLVVAPEYCVPWEVLVQSILAGHVPGLRALWVLGCESITTAELDALQGKFNNNVRVVFEDFDRAEAAKKGFLDPLAYVFHSKDGNGSDCLVLLLQFKTHPSIDDERIEGDNLFCGQSIYVFGTPGKTVRLLSFICSDAFAADAAILSQVDRQSLILHIQLNPNPRQSAFRNYRKYLFDYAADDTELICLNWSSCVRVWKEGAANPKDWKNIGGTAWYLRPDKFDDSDARVTTNHNAGLYYTWLKSLKWNVLFFNYSPVAFALKASKVWHHGVAMVQSKRGGPRVHDVLRWDVSEDKWKSDANLEDGFVALVNPHGAAVDPLRKIHAANPISVERLLALTAGDISQPDNWYTVRELHSFAIEETEYIKRITFTQDPEPTSADFRSTRVRTFVSCYGVLRSFTSWPPELADLAGGYEFNWNDQFPHSNVVSSARKQATIVYLGEDRLEEDLRRVGDKLRTALHRRGHLEERLGIFHRSNGQPLLWLHPDSKRIDKPKDASSIDIAGS